MANIKSSKKRVLVNRSRALRNKKFKSLIKTTIRDAVEASAGQGNSVVLRRALGCLDKAVSKGVLKRNTADRKKSSLVKKCSALV